MSEKELKIGDAIARLTRALGIRHCPRCEQRRLILNEMRRLGIRETARRLMSIEKNSGDETENVKKIMKELEECCDK